MDNELYHEKQVKQLCALHALNNLFQDKNAFCQKDLDSICHALSPTSRFINPHKSSLGLGNYDVNVLMTAVQQKGFEAVWFDKRKNPEHLRLDRIKGFILNIPNPSYSNKWGAQHLINLPLSFLMSKKHWISIIKFHENYFNLDSKLDRPSLVGGGPELMKYLRDKIETNDCEVFIVVSRADAAEHSYIDV
jgi:josephin